MAALPVSIDYWAAGSFWQRNSIQQIHISRKSGRRAMSTAISTTMIAKARAIVLNICKNAGTIDKNDKTILWLPKKSCTGCPSNNCECHRSITK